MKIQNFALFAMMLAIFAAGCNYDTRDYSQPIAVAMQGRQQAYATATTTLPARGKTVYQVSLTVFAAEMRKIDVSGCPSDFRAAWTDYISTVEDRARKEPVLGYAVPGGGGGSRGEPMIRSVVTAQPAPGHKWDVPLDHNGMELIGVWEQLNDAAEKHKPPQQ